MKFTAHLFASALIITTIVVVLDLIWPEPDGMRGRIALTYLVGVAALMLSSVIHEAIDRG